MNSLNEETEIAIIGAGVIGIACALRLVKDGAQVLLIDRGEPGMACSFGNAAHIATELVFPLASPQSLRSLPNLLFDSNSPLRIDPRYIVQAAPWLLRFAHNSLPHRYKRGVKALASIQAIAAGEMRTLLHAADAEDLLQMGGHLMLAEEARSKPHIEQLRIREERLGVPSEWKNPAEIALMAPDVTRNIAGAVYYPETGHVSNPHHVNQRLLDAFEQAGGRIMRNNIDRISTGAPSGFELEGDSGVIKAAKIIVAAGAWSNRLSRQLGCSAPLEAERGYHITAHSYRPQMRTPVSSFERNVIMTPLDEGLRITGFVEFAGLTKPARQHNVEKLKCQMRALVPDIDLDDATSWLGHRPSLPDYLPVIGATRKCKNAYFAFGHQHLGLTLAGATAAMISEIVAGKTPPIDAAPFSIDRF